MVRSTVVLLTIICSSSLNAFPQYELIDLGTLDENFSSANAINERGQITGNYGDLNQSRQHNPTSTFIGDRNGIEPVQGLAGAYDSSGTDINDNGQVVGSVTFNKGDDYRSSFLFDNGNLEYLPKGVRATTINNKGQLAGTMGEGVDTHAFITIDGQIVEIDSAEGTGSLGNGLNQSGQVAGVIYDSDSRHAAYGDKTGLTVLPGLSDQSSTEAVDINDAGFLAGVRISEGMTSTFLADRNGLIVPDIGQLSGATRGWALNDYNHIVGSSYDVGTDAAILWTPEEGLVRLADLVDDMEGWYGLGVAGDINNAGQIVGLGIRDTYELHGFLLDPISETPVSETGTGLLLVTGLSLLILRRTSCPRKPQQSAIR